MKGKFCTDTDSQGEISTLSGYPFECNDEQRSLSELKSHIQLHHAEKNPAGETPQSSSNTTSANLLCPFECTDKPFETKNDQKEHLIKNTHAHLLQKIHQQKMKIERVHDWVRT